MTRILLVEDSPTQAQELAFLLQDAGFQVGSHGMRPRVFSSSVVGLSTWC